MGNLKQYISGSLQIDEKRLHEISLEDVQLFQDTLQDICTVVDEILIGCCPEPLAGGPLSGFNDGIPCRGYWVEGTKDLVIYIALKNLSRTIVIPQQGWMIREDITIN